MGTMGFLVSARTTAATETLCFCINIGFSCFLSLETEASMEMLVVFLLASMAVLSQPSEARLYNNYYSRSCPRFDTIINETVTNKQITNPLTAAATLCLFLHNCFITDCDGSTLISSTLFNSAERDADINLSFPGDAFDAIVRAKTRLKLECSGIVSCANILTAGTRDLIVMVGDPYYDIVLGRKDGRVSKASAVEGNMRRPTMSMDQIIGIFTSKGFSVQEMVALSGAHTIGFSHCKEFTSKIYNYSKTQQTDPQYNPRFASGLRSACSDYYKNPTLSVFNDIMTPNKFDSSYFQNLPILLLSIS